MTIDELLCHKEAVGSIVVEEVRVLFNSVDCGGDEGEGLQLEPLGGSYEHGACCSEICQSLELCFYFYFNIIWSCAF